MAIIRCQVRLPYFTNLPEDVATNTLYYRTPNSPPTTGELDDIEAQIVAFYTAIGDRIGAVVLRTTNACSIRYYDLSQSEPRQPVRTDTFNLPAAATPNNLPLECAIVLSYHAEFSSGTSNARRRGRIYIGPLNLTCFDDGDAATRPTVSATAIADIIAAVPALHGIPTNGTEWSQYSPTTDLGLPVVGGFVNNEMDTQRRRQATETGRTTFVV